MSKKTPMVPGLFGEDVPAWDPEAKPGDSQWQGAYWRRPGTGPEGETCRTCKHKAYSQPGSKKYIKCGRVGAEGGWTRGPGSDIKAGSPACEGWQ